MIFDIKKLVEDREYAKENNLKVKKDEKTGLFIIKYDKRYLTKDNISTLGYFRSVITDGVVIKSMAPTKSIDFDKFKEENKVEDCIVEEFVEGTMINCFYTENGWEIATRSVIGANCSFMQTKSFREMFFEAFEEMKLTWELFNPKYSYSFVLQHPDNRIVINFTEKNLVLVAVQHQTFLEKVLPKALVEQKGGSGDLPPEGDFVLRVDILSEEFQDLRNKIKIPERYPYGENWNKIYNLYSECNYNILGCIIKNKMGERSKIRNKNYEEVRRLRGNSTKLQYQYYNLRKLKKINEFLKYFPEYDAEFLKMQKEIHSWTQELFDNYRNCFIHKKKKLKDYPFQFRIQMYNLHQLYLSRLRDNGLYINKDIVKGHINRLDPAALMYLINFKNKI